MYLECGIIGSTIFTYVYMKAAAVSRMSFVLMSYIFFECYFNHLFGAGCTHIWILTYLMMSVAGITTKNKEIMEKKNGTNNSFYTNL